MNPHDIVLTGIPRSGTTWVCHLLGGLPDTVALHEPMNAREVAATRSLGEVCARTRSFFESARATILAGTGAISKNVGGELVDNYMEPAPAEGATLRRDIARKGRVEISRPSTSDFDLVIKHPALFTAALGELRLQFRCLATIRNPLAVLASWESIDMAARRGRAPIAEMLDDGLREQLEREGDQTRRRLLLLHWYFAAYRGLLPATAILRYEEIVESGGSILRRITPRAEGLAGAFRNQNDNPAYDRVRLRALADSLLASEGAYWDFYTRDSVLGIRDARE